MTTYRIDPVSHAPLIRRMIRRQLAFVFVLLVVLVPVVISVGAANDTTPITLGFLVVFVPVTAALNARNMRRIANSYVETYSLRIEGDTLTCSAQQLAAVTISRMEVTTITEDSRTGLTIQGRDRFHSAFIPRSLSGYADARALLLSWKDASAANSKPLYLTAVGTLVGISAWIGTGVLPFRFAMLSGLVLLCLIAVYLRELHKTPIDPKLKSKIVPGMVMSGLAPIARAVLYFVIPAYEDVVRQFWN